MNFKILLVYLYGIAQLYVVSFRTTVTVQALACLFMVGALSSAAAAVTVQWIVTQYFSEWATVLKAVVEEIAKASPALYLLFRTNVGRSASLLDGLLYGAAIGAGFGFVEDAIYTMENVSLPTDMDVPLGGLLLTWLPGGWPNDQAWFPGHMVLAALAGAGFACARRLFRSTIAHTIVCAAVFSWVAFLHAGFNEPTNVESPFASFLYYTVNGGGRYLAPALLGVIVLLLVLEERWIRRHRESSAVPGAPDVAQPKYLLGDLAILMNAIGRGWRSAKAARTLLRHKEELVNVTFDAEREASADADGVRLCEIARERVRKDADDVVAAAESKRGTKPDRSGNRGAVSVPGTLLLLLFAPVWGYGLWMVFLSPFLDHGSTVAILNSVPMAIIAIVGQALVFWRCCVYLRAQRHIPEPLEASALVVRRCRTILAWTSAFLCVGAWKDLYDVGSFPYPFRPAELDRVVDQARACAGRDAAARSVVGPAAAGHGTLGDKALRVTRPPSSTKGIRATGEGILGVERGGR